MFPLSTLVPEGLTIPDGARVFSQNEGYWRIRYIDPYTGKKCFEMLHRFIYGQLVGPIPKGYVVHHIDGNIANNALGNLLPMPRDIHSRLHRLHPELKSPQHSDYYARHADRKRDYYRRRRAPKRRKRTDQVVPG